ncbi:DNA topoisomerase I, partial [filamentous cyanobacterium CCP1]
VLLGPYGPYVQLGDKTDDNPKPKRASLPKGMTMQDVTMDLAVGLLSLPRTLGVHPETGAKIQANLGRFGPYVMHAKGSEGKPEYRSLKKEDDVLTVSLERALQLLSEPKSGRGRSKTAAKPLRELGAHPEDNEPVNIYDGPYGPYIKHGKINASLPEGQTVESVTMEIAVQALAEKASTKKKTSRSSKSTGSKSTASTSSKTTKKASTTKKTTKTAAKSRKTAKTSTNSKSTKAKSAE